MWCGGVSTPPLCAERGAVQNRRADRVVRPYGSVTRNAEQVLAGGVEPRPYGGLQVVRKRNPPGTVSPCQPPLGKGAWGRGIRIATTSDIGHWFRNDREFCMGCVSVSCSA